MKSVSLITGGLSFLLSACSAGGGGSFDVDNVSNASSSKPHYQDDTSNSRTKSNCRRDSPPLTVTPPPSLASKKFLYLTISLVN